MKKVLFLASVLVAACLCGTTMAGCSSTPDEPQKQPEKPETPAPQPEPDPEPEPVKSEFGLDPAAIDAYFRSRITDGTGSYTASSALASGDADKAAAYVWNIWKNAVNAYDSEKLPSLSGHSALQSWYYVTKPDGVWQLPDGNMNIFYGSKGSKPDEGYPLFVYLHGSGSDAHEEWIAGLSWAHYFNDAPSAYFVPQSPKGGSGCRWYQPSRQMKWERVIRQAFISDNIDPLRLYFIGISEGAYGSQRLSAFYADYLAGAGPIAGGELLYNCPPENYANIAFCLQTGAEDTMYGRTLLTAKVRARLDDLEEAHPGLYIHKVDLQPGKGHGCDYTVTTPWLKNYSRKALPRYFYWEDYGMGGINGEEYRHREGFYYMQVLEPSDDRSDNMVRTCYEMTVADDNTIALNVNIVRCAESEHASGNGWQMNVGVEKSYTPATKGKIRIYLSSELVDLSKPVSVTVNGTERYHDTVTPDTRHLVESCALYFDPLRVFPAAIDIDI